MKSEREIFLNAIEFSDEPSQARYLDEVCGNNAELRASVEQLIRAKSNAAEFLEDSPPVLALTIRSEAGLDGATDQVSLDFLTPSDKPGCLGTLGIYEVVGTVGRGAFGIVLRAYDTKLNRVVAIKVMSPELATNPIAVKRFLREAQAAAAVRHDHVVTIHAIDETNSPPFIVMEYVQGESLKEKIDRDGALELTEILRIGKQMAVGLAAAHEQGLVHRDIKPANILLENGIKRVKITDFGLARAVDEVGMTQTGIIAGTPQYMSPEQGLGKPIDARSDLFSLGAVLYALCTGQAAFRADSAVATLRQVCDEEPKSIREINQEIPAWLDDLVMRLLSKDANDRIQSANEVKAVFSSCLTHLQSGGTTPLPTSIGVKRVKSQPWNPLLSFLIWVQLLGTLISAVYGLANPHSQGGGTLILFAFGLGIPLTVMAAKAKAGWTVIGYGLFWPAVFVLSPVIGGLLQFFGKLEQAYAALAAGLLVGVTWGIFALWKMVPGWKPKRSSFLWPTERLYWLFHATQCVVLSGGLASSLVEPDSIIPATVLAAVVGVPLTVYACWLSRDGLTFLFAITGPVLALFCAIAGSTMRGIDDYVFEHAGPPTVRILVLFVVVAVLFGLIGIRRKFTDLWGEKGESKQFGLKSRLIFVALVALVLALAGPFLGFSGEAYVAGCVLLGTLVSLTVLFILYMVKTNLQYGKRLSAPRIGSAVLAVICLGVMVTVSGVTYQHETLTRYSNIYFEGPPNKPPMEIEIIPIGWLRSPGFRPYYVHERQRFWKNSADRSDNRLLFHARRGKSIGVYTKGEFEIKILKPKGLKAVPSRLNPAPRVRTKIKIVPID